MFDHLADKDQVKELTNALENSGVPAWATQKLLEELDKEVRTYDKIDFQGVTNTDDESTFSFDLVLTERTGPSTSWQKRAFCRDIKHELYDEDALASLQDLLADLELEPLKLTGNGSWPQREALLAGHYAVQLAQLGYSTQFSATGRVLIMNADALKQAKEDGTLDEKLVTENIYSGLTPLLALAQLATALAKEPLKANTFTLTEAVKREVDKFVEGAMDFTAHDVTTAIRKNVDTEYFIDGLSTFTDGNGVQRTNITHNDVKDAVTTMYHNGEIPGYRREQTPKYWLFKPATPKSQPAPAQRGDSVNPPASANGARNTSQPAATTR